MPPSPIFFSHQHGGTDGLGLAPWDFSTNSNAYGPCPAALAQVRQTDASHYPDPHYHVLREALADWHGVARERVLLGASSSELIHRIHLWARLQGIATVCIPQPAYGDYAQQAQAMGLQVRWRSLQTGGAHAPTSAGDVTDDGGLHWACSPSSPLGWPDPILPHWQQAGAAAQAGALRRFLDAAYAPLALTQPGEPPTDWLASARQRPYWQLFSPNKSLGLTGVRAAYAIAPPLTAANAPAWKAMQQALLALAPSWPIGAHGVALLHAWTDRGIQAWLAQTRLQLAQLKQRQIALCTSLGWQVLPGSQTPYFAARPLPHVWQAYVQGQIRPEQAQALFAQALAHLRQAGVKLRDTASMGLPLHVRVSAQLPAAQEALAHAWHRLPARLREGGQGFTG